MKASRAFVAIVGLPGLALGQVCSDIEDDAKRLACYDASNQRSAASVDEKPPPAVSQGISSAPAGADEPAPGPSNAAIVEAESPENFGRIEDLDRPKEYIESTIVQVKTDGLKVDYLRLDNGQVWREIEDNGIRFREGRKVTITEGIFGSFDLQMEGANKIVKVRRLD